MSDIAISFAVLVVLCGGVLMGSYLRSALPQDYLGGDSKDALSVGVGLVVTITAVVLAMLI